MRKLKFQYLSVLGSIMFVGGVFSVLPQSSNAQDIPEHPEYTICRCHSTGCFGGNAISLRPRCGETSAENSECSTFNNNCVGTRDEKKTLE